MEDFKWFCPIRTDLISGKTLHSIDFFFDRRCFLFFKILTIYPGRGDLASRDFTGGGTDCAGEGIIYFPCARCLLATLSDPLICLIAVGRSQSIYLRFDRSFGSRTDGQRFCRQPGYDERLTLTAVGRAITVAVSGAHSFSSKSRQNVMSTQNL